MIEATVNFGGPELAVSFVLLLIILGAFGALVRRVIK